MKFLVIKGSEISCRHCFSIDLIKEPIWELNKEVSISLLITYGNLVEVFNLLYKINTLLKFLNGHFNCSVCATGMVLSSSINDWHCRSFARVFIMRKWLEDSLTFFENFGKYYGKSDHTRKKPLKKKKIRILFLLYFKSDKL